MYNKCVSLLLQVYFKSRSSTDEGAWMHKVALTKTLHIRTKSSAKLLELRLNSNEINVMKSI